MGRINTKASLTLLNIQFKWNHLVRVRCDIHELSQLIICNILIFVKVAFLITSSCVSICCCRQWKPSHLDYAVHVDFELSPSSTSCSDLNKQHSSLRDTCWLAYVVNSLISDSTVVAVLCVSINASFDWAAHWFSQPNLPSCHWVHSLCLDFFACLLALFA